MKKLKINPVLIAIIGTLIFSTWSLAIPTMAAEDSSRAVVLIKSFAVDSSNFLNNYAQGSGTLISADGIILTNYHVVTQFTSEGINDSTYQICVTESAGKEPNCSYVASLIAKDKSLDVALLKISGIDGAITSGLPFLKLSNADTLKVGDSVTAIGYPGIGGKTMTTTKGIVSGKVDNQYNLSWIKTDALISFGSSGGALIDSSGNLVGITTAVSSSLSATLGYAVNAFSVSSWVNNNITGQPQVSNLQSRLIDFTIRSKYVNSSNVYENSGQTFSIIKPADWSFNHLSEKKVLIYDANDIDSGYVSINVFRVGYKAPVNAANGVLRRYYNESGASALINITSDKEVKVNNLKARLLSVSTMGETYNYYAFSDGNYFIFVGYDYGSDQKDRDVVNGIINSISIKAGSQPFSESKAFSEKNYKLNLKANGNWVFMPKASPVSPLDIYNKKIFNAYGRINYIVNGEETNKMNNQQYLDYLKQRLTESNQITGIINYKVEVIKSQANASINGKIKNVIRIDSVEKSVSDNKILAYDTDYYINLNDVYLNINLTVYGSDKKVYNQALVAFNSMLANFSVDMDRKTVADVYKLINDNKFDQALKKADEIKNLDTRADVLAILFSNENFAGQHPNALKVALKMYKIKPKDYLTLNYLGLAYLNLKDYKNAEKYLLQSIKRKGDFEIARRNLGNVYIGTKKYDLAEQQLLKVVSLVPKNSKAYYSLGLVYLNQKKNDQAITYFQKALDLNNDMSVLEDNVVVSAHYQLGILYGDHKKNYQSAVDHLTIYLKARPEDAANIQSLIDLYSHCINNNCDYSAKSLSCTDSDNGLNYTVRGYSTEAFENGKTSTYNDTCSLKSSDGSYFSVDSCDGEACYLQEVYVNNYSQCDFSLVNCSKGCSQGACIN